MAKLLFVVGSLASFALAQPTTGDAGSQVAACPANSTYTASPAPACTCNTGLVGKIVWDATSNSWSGSCATDPSAICGNPVINKNTVNAQTGEVQCLCDQEREIYRVMNGISTVEVGTAKPSQILATGRNSFPLIRDTATRILAAAAFMGSGRVVTIGHESLLQSTATGLSQLLLNIVGWAAEKSESSGTGKVVGFESQLPTTTQILTSAGYTVVTRAGAADLSGVDVFVTTNSIAYTDAQIAAIQDFVRRGGGLITGGSALAWAQNSANSGKSVIDEFPGNRLLGASGLYVLATSVDGGNYKLSEYAPTPLAQSTCALEAIVRQSKGEINLNEAQRAWATDGVNAMLKNTPTAHPLFADLRKFSDATGPIVPTDSKPLTPATDLARAMAARVQIRLALDSPPESTVAHPAGNDFPGAIPADAPRVTRSITIDGNDFGSPMDGDTLTGVAWRSTGLYAAPGDVITVTIDAAYANKGLYVQIGAHTDLLYNADSWNRMPEIVRNRVLTSATTKMASGFGGPIYILVAAGRNLGPVPVTIAGGVEMGWHKQGRDGDSELAAMKQLKTPFFEIESDGFVATLLSSDLKSKTSLDAVHAHWSKTVKVNAQLAGFDRMKYRAERMVADRQISGGYMHSGYPFMTHLDGGGTVVAPACGWGHVHEMGHNLQQRDIMLPGTGETVCNIYSLYVCAKVCNLTFGEAHPNLTPANRLNTLKTWKSNPVPSNFGSGSIALEMYMQLQEKFGWALFETVLPQARNRPASQRPANNDNARIQQWILDTSIATSTNLVPFYRLWAFPIDSATEAAVSGFPAWLDSPPADIPCGNTSVVCKDNNPLLKDQLCTVALTCNSQTCCDYTCEVAGSEGRGCDDKNPATFNDKCTNGTCIGTTATCSNMKTAYGGCAAGFILQSAKSCTPGVDCNVTTCCVLITTCGMLDPTCDSVSHLNMLAPDLPCTYGVNCTKDACCKPYCTFPANEGAICDDGNDFTDSTTCSNGVCTGGRSSTCQRNRYYYTRNAANDCGDGYRFADKVCAIGYNCTIPLCCQPTNCATSLAGCIAGYVKRGAETNCTNCDVAECCKPTKCGLSPITCTAGFAKKDAATPCTDCGASECCKPVTCGAVSLTCNAGYAKKPDATACVNCDTTECCAPATCGTAAVTCPAGYASKDPGASCADCNVAQCCQPATCAAASVACPAGFTRQDTQACTMGTDCDATFRGAQSCCVPSTCGTASIQCGTGTTLSASKACSYASGACIPTTCCATVSTATTCGAVASTIVCPQYFQINTTQACTPGANCDANSCCKYICSFGTVNNYKACDDGNPVTYSDWCVSGVCKGTQPDCNNQADAYGYCLTGTVNLLSTRNCTRGVNCDRANCCMAKCTTVGAVCNDGLSTTINDKCVSGKTISSTSSNYCAGTKV